MTTFFLPTEADLRPKTAENSPDSSEIAPIDPTPLPPIPDLWAKIIYRPSFDDIELALAREINTEWPPKFIPYDEDSEIDAAWGTLTRKLPHFRVQYGNEIEYRRQYVESRSSLLLTDAPTPAWILKFQEPWRQMVDPVSGALEGDKSFSAFSAFLNLGINRTIKGAVLETNKQIFNQALFDVYQKWSIDWNWEDRAKAFDRSIAQKQTDHLATIKTQAQYKMHENMLKLAELNSKILSEGIVGNTEKVVGALALMRQTETMDQATRMYTALHGSKTEVKGEMNVNLAHAILTAEPHTINI